MRAATPGSLEAEMVDNAVLVVAHPDDDVLWFSSVLSHVCEIVFCFLDHRANPALGPARRRALARYPLRHTALGLLEAGTFNTVDWTAPVETESGLALPGAGSDASAQYLANATILPTRLAEVIGPYRNVITHNPWGEYGHPDHVQVYRVLASVTAALQRPLWFSNYVSNLSLGLHLRYASGFSSRYVSLATDTELAHRGSRIYKAEGCWTWSDDFEWFREETFVNLSAPPRPAGQAPEGQGSPYPLNVVKLPAGFKMRPEPRPALSLLAQVRSAEPSRGPLNSRFARMALGTVERAVSTASFFSTASAP
jgi:LmbE family N-acetylglucosaminyl deacetylase